MTTFRWRGGFFVSLLAACAALPAPGETSSWPPVRFAPAALAAEAADGSPETWLRLPFPSDERRREDGTIVFSDMPIGSSIIRRWREDADRLRGFSTQSAVFFSFTAPIPVAHLPQDPAASLGSGSVLRLVDLAPGTSHGRRYPLRWRFTIDATNSVYLASNTLAIAPVEGYLFEENHVHVALVLTPVVAILPTRSPAFSQVLSVTPPTDAASVVRWTSFAPLRAYLAEEHLDTSRVVAATLFTTGAPTSELRALSADAARRATATYANISWKPPTPGSPLVAQKSFTFAPDQTVSYRLIGGEANLANYQEGEVPYETTGGAFVGGASPNPRPDRTNITLTVPAAAPVGAACFPVVIYAHGTGGDALSHVRDGTAPRLAARGIATFSFDQPMHGLRALGKTFDVSALTFNMSNPSAFRTTMRQGALDLVQMHALSTQLPALPPEFSPLPLCAGAASVFGHSQGGLSAAMALGAGLAPLRTVISGAGGALHVTIAERKDPIDFAGFVRIAAKIDESEALDDRHPIMALLQTLGDVSDPASYARYFSEGAVVLQTAGFFDTSTPYRSATALAIASRQTLVGAEAWPSEPLAIVALFSPLAPINTRYFLEFGPGTRNLDASHWVVFERPEAIESTMGFLVNGRVVRDENATSL